MPKWYAEQPDGRLAQFSTVVDAFTQVGLSDEDVFDNRRDKYETREEWFNAARHDIVNARIDLIWWWHYKLGPPDGRQRWRGALKWSASPTSEGDAMAALDECESISGYDYDPWRAFVQAMEWERVRGDEGDVTELVYRGPRTLDDIDGGS